MLQPIILWLIDNIFDVRPCSIFLFILFDLKAFHIVNNTLCKCLHNLCHYTHTHTYMSLYVIRIVFKLVLLQFAITFKFMDSFCVCDNSLVHDTSFTSFIMLKCHACKGTCPFHVYFLSQPFCDNPRKICLGFTPRVATLLE